MLLTPQFHDELTLWRNFITFLDIRPKHLRDIRPHHLTWKGVSYAYITGMGGVCQSLSGQWFVWRLQVVENTAKILLTEEKPQWDLTINDLELAAYVAHLNFFSLLIKTLDQTTIKKDNTAVEGSSKRGSVSLATTIGPLFREIAWIKRQAGTHLSVSWISGEYK